MKFKILFICIIGLFSGFSAVAQTTMLKGNVVDNVTKVPLAGVELVIEGTSFKAITDENGNFDFGSQDLPEGDQVLLLSRELYLDSKFDIVLTKGETLELKGLFLAYDTSTESLNTGIISLTENDLGDDENAANNLGGLLQASRDVFYRAAAFDFSATFFRPRGYNSENGKVLINGLEMNKLFDGRPQWSNWGGLNDMQRNQTFAVGLAPVDNTFGGVAGTQSINMRASSYRKGGRISYAAANQSYIGRVMATYSSGLMSNGWAYSISGSRRFAEEGFVDGTLYDANSIGLSVEKKINEEHALNFTGMYTPNRRGRRTSMTNEERALKGIRYNPFWGYQNGDIRNSRNREIEEPIFMLNHYWTLSPKTTLNTNIGYQFGKIGNTRIDNGGTDLVQIDGQNVFLGGARNPSPNYWQLLPSFFLQSATPSAQDFQNAFLAAEQFRNDGQFDWNQMYEANRIQAERGRNSVYIVQEDRIDDQQLMANIILNTQFNDNILFDAGVNYRNLNSENYARVNDLLGGTGFLDVDFFSDEVAQENANINDIGQSDVRNPNRIVREGDRYKYNYEIDAEVYGAFAQAQFRYNKIDFYTSANISRTTYQRTGIFENGNFQGSRSFGKGEEVDFTDYGVKGGFTYKVTGRHLIDVNAGFITQAPFIRNTFSNARQNHDIVDGIDSEEITTVDASYIFRGTKLKAKITGFYTEFANGTNVGFYFTEDLTGLPLGEGDAFVQEVTTNIDRRNVGVEAGIEYQVTPTILLKGAANVSQNVFTNNPDLYLTSQNFPGQLRFGDGTTKLEDFHVAGGPERAYQVGFEYRDPDFWWVGASLNYFSNAYVDVSRLRRSDNFTLDFDGQPFVSFDEAEARNLLKQEELDDYMLVNLVGGKSWRIDRYFVGFFASINNLFAKEFRTGGFEQSRKGTFENLRDDVQNGRPTFGNRYFFGNGTTYFINAYVRF